MATNKTYISINPVGCKIDSANELCIESDYQKGGVNYFSGKIEPSGVFVYLKPVHRKDGIVSSVLLGNSTKEMGFKVMAHPISRRSAKQVERVFGAVLTIKEQIADLYNQEKFSEIADLIKETVAKAK